MSSKVCRHVRPIGLLFCLIAPHGLLACASGGGGLSLNPGSVPSVTGFKESNAVAPQGYQFTSSEGDTLRVMATGSASTPNERLVKIALAAAAQHGAGQFKKTFRAGEPAYSVKCGVSYVTERGVRRTVTPNDYRVATVDVTFGKSSTDPADRPTKETAAALLAELQSETIPPETQAALVAQLAQVCGRMPQ